MFPLTNVGVMILVSGVFGAGVIVTVLSSKFFGGSLTEGTGVLDGLTMGAVVEGCITMGVTTTVVAETVAVDIGAWTVIGEGVTVGRGMEQAVTVVTVGIVVIGLTVLMRSLQLESLQQLILPLRMTQWFWGVTQKVPSEQQSVLRGTQPPLPQHFDVSGLH